MDDIKKFNDFDVLANELINNWDKLSKKERDELAQKMVVIYMSIDFTHIARACITKLKSYREVYSFFREKYKEEKDGESISLSG